MARPKKAGLDYFPLDVDMDLSDDDVKILQTKYGNDGFTILIKLYMKIYSKDGYFYKWGEKESLLHANRCNCDFNLVNSVVNDLLEWGFFDKDKFEQYSILTSKRIQETYIDATQKRSKIDMFESFLSANKVKSHVNLIKGGINPQSKVKESKVKESKEVSSENPNVFKFYQDNIKLLTPFATDELKHYLDDGFEEQMMIEVIKDSLDKDYPWTYAKAILDKCLKKKVLTLERYKADKESRRKKNGGSGNGKRGQGGQNTGNYSQDADFSTFKQSGNIDDSGLL